MGNNPSSSSRRNSTAKRHWAPPAAYPSHQQSYPQPQNQNWTPNSKPSPYVIRTHMTGQPDTAQDRTEQSAAPSSHVPSPPPYTSQGDQFLRNSDYLPPIPTSPTSTIDNCGPPPNTATDLVFNHDADAGSPRGHHRTTSLLTPLPPRSRGQVRRPERSATIGTGPTRATTQTRHGPENALELLRKFDTVFIVDG